MDQEKRTKLLFSGQELRANFDNLVRSINDDDLKKETAHLLAMFWNVIDIYYGKEKLFEDDSCFVSFDKCIDDALGCFFELSDLDRSWGGDEFYSGLKGLNSKIKKIIGENHMSVLVKLIMFSPDPLNVLNQIRNNIKNSVLNSGEVVQKNVVELEGLINSKKNEIESLSGGFISHVEKSKEDVNKVSASATIQKFSSAFMDDADGNKIICKKWLWLSVLFMVLTISFSVYIYFYENYNGVNSDLRNSTFFIVNKLSSKIIIVFILLSGLFWSAKFYRIYSNEMLINLHKHKVLSTYSTLVSGAKDDVVKDSILMEATKVIFSRIDPGFLDDKNVKKDDGVDDILKIISLVSQKQLKGDK